MISWFSKQYIVLFYWQLIIGIHSLNAVFLLGDTALNSLVSCLGLNHKSFPALLMKLFSNSSLLFLSEVSLVPDRIFLHVDTSICPIPVDCPCHFQTLVKSFPVLFLWWNQIYHCFLTVEFCYCLNRWPYPFLDLSSPYAPLWYWPLSIEPFNSATSYVQTEKT